MATNQHWEKVCTFWVGQNLHTRVQSRGRDVVGVLGVQDAVEVFGAFLPPQELSSLPLALGEMAAVAALSALGTAIEQGEEPQFYAEKYVQEVLAMHSGHLGLSLATPDPKPTPDPCVDREIRPAGGGGGGGDGSG